MPEAQVICVRGFAFFDGIAAVATTAAVIGALGLVAIIALWFLANGRRFTFNTSILTIPALVALGLLLVGGIVLAGVNSGC